MERITNQKHSKDTFITLGSLMFERASFYGLRGIIVLYMTGEVIKMSDAEALSLYGWFATILVFSQILGAVIGDLIFGNRQALILGAIIQSIGAFIFCINSTTGLYIAAFLVLFGAGLYRSNMLALFGKLYLNKTKLLDGGFALYYMVVNVGAFIGALFIGYLGEEFGWNFGFIAAGIIMLLSALFLLLSNRAISFEKEKQDLPIKQRTLIIALAVLFVGLFWYAYNIADMRIMELRINFIEYLDFDFLGKSWQSFNTSYLFPLGIIVAVLWSYFYSNQFVKLSIGFLFAVLSFAILLLIPEVSSGQYIVLFLISMFFLRIAEVHIDPILYSIATQYANPKYLAIVMSLVFIPTVLFNKLAALFFDNIFDDSLFVLQIGIIIMFVCFVGLMLFVLPKLKR